MSQRRLAEIDAFKGLLICLIVLGHGTLFSNEYPIEFRVLYNFHVACFLLLPCIFYGQSVQGLQVADRLTRYGVPHILFFLLACVLFFYLFIPKNLEAIQQWFGSVAVALAFSSEETYNTAVGLRLFWFLPALLSLLFVRSWYFGSGVKGKILLLSFTIIVHGFLGLVPAHLLPYIPFGLPLVLFLFPIGLLVGSLWKRYGNRTWFYWISIIVFFISIYFGVKFDSYTALAGDPRVYSILQPAQLVFHDVYLMSAFFALIGLMRFSPQFIQRLFAFVGAKSLPIFLLHSFIWQGFVRVGLVEWMGDNLQPSMAVVSAFLCTLISAILVSILIEKIKSLHTFIFPGNRDEWRNIWLRRVH